MTQFDLLKAGYRQLIERGEMTAEEVAAKIRVLDFLASCSKDDIYEIVDSAILSDIIKGYTQKACNAAGLSDAQTEKRSFLLPLLYCQPFRFFSGAFKKRLSFPTIYKRGTKSKKPPQPNEAAFSQSSK